MSVFAVLAVREEINVNVLGLKRKLELSYAEGMFGVIPVFKDEKSALDYVGDGQAQVMEFEELEKAGVL
tara:strand:- start:649 stop:855 length:207 start_codon:yes stop_codon:yes gene_type:complete